MATLSPSTLALSEFRDISMSGVFDCAASATPNWEEGLLESKIFIVDDERINVLIAAKYLGLAGYRNLITTTDPRAALAIVTNEAPDLVLLDIMMPHISGLDVLAQLRAEPKWAHLPVVILTAANDLATKKQALELGASDFLAKPVDPSELLPRVRNVLTVKRHQDHLKRYSRELEAAVLRRTAELARSRQEVIHCLARAAEFRDDGHRPGTVFRVGRYARLIAEGMGWSGGTARYSRTSGPAPRYRQDRHSGFDPAQARQADRGRIRNHAEA